MSTRPESAASSIRQAFDLCVCFVLAVILLRAFVLEGYLISTGSMAPGLLGFHRQITCPSCQYPFAFGVAFDDSVSPESGHLREPEGLRRLATCPMCGQQAIDVAEIPTSHGDQLLVNKHVYDLRRPRRWETVVFRNPSSPREAFVKRIVGLPGESIRIINGDVHINGELIRKSLPEQLDLRIPVCDLQYSASSENWQLPWDADAEWQFHNAEFQLRTAPSGSPADTTSDDSDAATDLTPHWIRFRNWRWTGGHHVAETPLQAEDATDDWQRFQDRFADIPLALSAQVNYDHERQVLMCEGVMTPELQQSLLQLASNTAFRAAVFRLAALSHLAPITDRYGYNSQLGAPEHVVSDLMLETELQWTSVPRAIHVRIPIGADTFGLVLQPAQNSILLMSLEDKQILRQGTLQPLLNGLGSLKLQVSGFDRQILVTVNDQQAFPALPVDGADTATPFVEASVSPIDGKRMDPERAALIQLRQEQQNRWALGVAAQSVKVVSLRMYRDVFYTPGRRRNAVDSEFQIPENCYFVQGDNSPVSSDSRNWEQPAVPHNLLLGKPFLVHLPSRPSILQFAGREWPIRIPDWRRIRYIH
jgi:signal peptidase I